MIIYDIPVVKMASHKRVNKDSLGRETLSLRIEPIVLLTKGGSRVAAISKMECFVIIVNSFLPFTIITKRSILDVGAALDPPLLTLVDTVLKCSSKFNGVSRMDPKCFAEAVHLTYVLLKSS